jgi:hypothetical protein
MARLCDQLALSEADHLLEIGTGWGDGGIRGPSLWLSGDYHHAVAGAIRLGNRADRPRRVAGSC